MRETTWIKGMEDKNTLRQGQSVMKALLVDTPEHKIDLLRDTEIIVMRIINLIHSKKEK